MRSFNPLLVPILSFVTFVASGPLHSITHSSRHPANPISSRQFHYPRALADVCVKVDVALLNVVGLNLLSDTCLCLSAFPLNLGVNGKTQLSALGQTESGLKSFVKNSGTQCTYPDHASPMCTSGNVCDFSCTDGFVKNGGSCVCSPPNSVCNGKCGSTGCPSPLPKPPKMTRKRAASGFDSRDITIAADVDVDLKRSVPPSGSPNLKGLDANKVLNSLGITLPVSGVTQSTNVVANLNVCVGDAISETQALLDDTTDFFNSLLSLLLGVHVDLNVGQTPSTPTNPSTVSLALQFCGLLGDSIDSTLSQILNEVTNLLNASIDGITIAVDYTGGSGCPATTTPLPPPSNPVANPNLSVSSLTLDLNASIADISGLVDKILASLGLTTINLGLDATADPTVVMSVGLSDTLSSIDGLVDEVIAIVKEVFDLLLVDTTIQINPGPTPSPALSDPSIVVNINLGSLLSDVPVSLDLDLGNTVNTILSVLSEVVAGLVNVDVVVNADGGSSCGCSGSRMASPKN